MNVFHAIMELNKTVGEMRDFIVNIDEKTPFSGAIFKYEKKYHFNVQQLTHLKNDNRVIFGKILHSLLNLLPTSTIKYF